MERSANRQITIVKILGFTIIDVLFDYHFLHIFVEAENVDARAWELGVGN